MQGKLCPGPVTKELLFDLKSNVLGEKRYPFKLEIIPPKEGSIIFFNFKGIDSVRLALLSLQNKEFKLPFLSIESIDENGKLLIAFSDVFIIPSNFTRLQEKEWRFKKMLMRNMEIIIDPLET